MPYSEPLDITTPSDASPISQGDDAIRQLKRAFLERLGRIVEDITADPWVLKKEAVADSGAVPTPVGATDLVKLIPVSRGVPAYFSDHPTVGAETIESLPSLHLGYSAGRIQVGPDHKVILQVDFDLPVGATVTKVRFRAYRGGPDCVASIDVVTWVDGVGTSVGAAAGAAVGVAWVDTGVIAAVVPANGVVGAKVTIAGSKDGSVIALAEGHILEVTYNMPA